MLQEWMTTVVAAFLYLTVTVEGSLSFAKNPSVRFFSNVNCTGEPDNEQEIDTCLTYTGVGNSSYSLLDQATKEEVGDFGFVDYPVGVAIDCTMAPPLIVVYSVPGSNNCSLDTARLPQPWLGGMSLGENTADYCLSMPTLGTSVIFTCPPPGTCSPQYKMTKKACQKRMNECSNQGTPMKWVGKGCKSKKGKKSGDGGCQCSGYCGYKCAKACRKDKECTWRFGRCGQKGGGQGRPMATCGVPLVF